MDENEQASTVRDDGELQCAADPHCPRPGRDYRHGLCWFHDLAGDAPPVEAKHAAKLRGSYPGLPALGWPG